MSMRVLIVGGVAGGMSCAARLRRLDESVNVTVFERGPNVSFANCGMPYFIGGIIEDRKKMEVQTPEVLMARYGLDVRLRQEVVAIDRDAKQIRVRDLTAGTEYTEAYDTLVLSPGASPIRPPIPGIELSHVHVLNNLPDMDRIRAAVTQAKSVCVVGGGFIGLELVENLRHLGLKVTLVELLDQVMPPLDKEMARPIRDELVCNGVNVILGDSASEIHADHVLLKSGARVDAEVVCMCAGVRPNSNLAKDAGLQLGARGHIHVDSNMCTSDPAIYAVGDAVEVRDFVTQEIVAVPLAGPANRQGRIAADNICGRPSTYGDAQGTSIVKVFNLAAGMTGLSEKRLTSGHMRYRKIYLHPTQHPGYYPGAKPISIKLLFNDDATILGAQAIGQEGVDVVIDVIATAMRGGLTVYDLENLELAYSPQWGTAKHGINMAGFLACNVLRGDVKVYETGDPLGDVLLLDCRTQAEMNAGMIPEAIGIPLDELRARVGELPKDHTIVVYCQAGLRGYVACRFLMQHGYTVKNLNGGYRTWLWHQPI